MQADWMDKLNFSEEIVAASLRLDIFMLFMAASTDFMVKLTVVEKEEKDRLDIPSQRKEARYQTWSTKSCQEIAIERFP